MQRTGLDGFDGERTWDKGYGGKKCWDEIVGKEHEMGMLLT